MLIKCLLNAYFTPSSLRNRIEQQRMHSLTNTQSLHSDIQYPGNANCKYFQNGVSLQVFSQTRQTVSQIIVGVLISFSVPWLCDLPGGKGLQLSQPFLTLLVEWYCCTEICLSVLTRFSCNKYCPVFHTYKITLRI